MDYWRKLLFKIGDLESKRNPTIPTRVFKSEIQDTVFSAHRLTKGIHFNSPEVQQMERAAIKADIN